MVITPEDEISDKIKRQAAFWLIELETAPEISHDLWRFFERWLSLKSAHAPHTWRSSERGMMRQYWFAERECCPEEIGGRFFNKSAMSEMHVFLVTRRCGKCVGYSCTQALEWSPWA
jgi:hypothetical protein